VAQGVTLRFAALEAASLSMTPTFLCGEGIQQLEALAAQWGWKRINKGWGWRTPGGTEVCHTRAREQLRGYRDAVLLVAPFESASAYHAGRIEEIIAAARGQGFDIRRAGRDTGDPLERGS
jgi:hypothetical protein